MATGLTWHHEGVHKAIVRTAAIGAGASAVAGVAMAGLGSYFVRQILTPARPREDETIVAADADTVTFKRTPGSSAPGQYGLHWDNLAGHARIGRITAQDNTLVTRTLLGVDSGELRPGRARLNSYFFPEPLAQDGTALFDVSYDGPIGSMSAWSSRPDTGADEPGVGQVGDTWAILVHGRGASRAETLRAVPLLRDLGLEILIPTYRNDPDAPPSADGRYHLGLSEWRDVEAALDYAVVRGARKIVLFGWSMGGAIVLQLLAHSAHTDRVLAVVLDAPVVSWRQVIDYHAGLHRVPLALSHTGQRLIGKSWSKSFGGVSVPIPVPHTDWISRADDLHVPTLLIHSEDDDFVPYGPSSDLARSRPDVIQFETWQEALHCREWNVDPARWRHVVENFVQAHVEPAGATSAART